MLLYGRVNLLNGKCIPVIKYELEKSLMQSKYFDLNDIQHEPTDLQLQTLMNSAASEANRRAKQAKEELMQRLRDDIIAANNG